MRRTKAMLSALAAMGVALSLGSCARLGMAGRAGDATEALEGAGTARDGGELIHGYGGGGLEQVLGETRAVPERWENTHYSLYPHHADRYYPLTGYRFRPSGAYLSGEEYVSSTVIYTGDNLFSEGEQK